MNPRGGAARTPAPGGRNLVIALPFAFLVAFFLLPFLIVLAISVAEMGPSGVRGLLEVDAGVLRLSLRGSGYAAVWRDPLYVDAALTSLRYAAATTLACLAIGHPFATFMARSSPAVRPALLMLVMMPFWTSFLLRVVAWRGLLADGGWIATALHAGGVDRLLVAAGLIAVPGQLMHTPLSLALGMTYTYLPFMILPLYAHLVRLDPRLLEAAADLGATPWVAYWRVTVPMSRSGIIAGSMLVFIPCVGEFVIPELLGGPQTLMIGRVLWDEFFSNNDWPMASAVATVLVLLVIVPMTLFGRHHDPSTGPGR